MHDHFSVCSAALEIKQVRVELKISVTDIITEYSAPLRRESAACFCAWGGGCVCCH